MLDAVAAVLAEGADARWRAAGSLLCHDEPRRGSLTGEALTLLVQITDQVEDMIAMRGGEPRAEITHEARDLRDATERLHRIVNAVTAVHMLDD